LLPEPGPENGGLRLRLIATPRADAAREGYDAKIDLLNVSDHPITLKAQWRSESDAGDVKDYLAAATSIECVPAVAPWVGGVAEGQRTSPQPEYVLKPGETLSANWQTDGRHLKNRVTNPNDVQNPHFPFDGLYAVHATIDVITANATVRLRSNEQLVSVGGSHAMPKYTLGRLWNVDPEKKTAVLSLGSLQKIAVGDQFEIGHPKGEHWKLTITRVEPTISFGELEVLPSMNRNIVVGMPTPHMDAGLIISK
jgi:hypothetical protein